MGVIIKRGVAVGSAQWFKDLPEGFILGTMRAIKKR
jgi:hypothetical protein